MNKKLQIVLLSCNAAGYLTLALSNMFRNSISDFTRGFFNGFAMVFILLGFAYIIWCVSTKRNPYKIQ